MVARSALSATLALALLSACSGESRTGSARDDGESARSGSGSSDAGRGSEGGAGAGGRVAGQSGAGGIAALGGAGAGQSGAGGIAGLGGAGAGQSGSAAGAGEGGLSMGGAGAASTAGVGGGGASPPCIPWPTPNNDPACPSPGLASTYVESPCVPELGCEFLVVTGEPCSQPPRLVPFVCCEWGFSATSCPSLPAGQDPRCVLPIAQNQSCDAEGLTCQVVVYEGGEPTGFICCDGYFRIASSC